MRVVSRQRSLPCLAFLLVVWLLALPRTSRAGSCIDWPHDTHPSNGAVVPRNTKFWLSLPAVFHSLASERRREVEYSLWLDDDGPGITADDIAQAYDLVGPDGEGIPFAISVLSVGRRLRPGYFVLG